jgi:16S rRNA (cytidine1402-2'-O)-methyltransferase
MGVLYIIPTPLGNLEDITLRALRVLREVALIATEDTRTTGKLLKHFDINTPMISYFEYSRQTRTKQILEALSQGDVALVSEAGTPLLSDPGFRLVQQVIEQQIQVVPLPGPSAITTALPASGLPTDQFMFLGFLPRKQQERQRLFTGIATQPATLIFYETPHRLLAALNDMANTLGANRHIAICRELTKLHEEIWRGTLAGAIEEWQARPPRGEFTLVVAGAAAPQTTWNTQRVETALVTAVDAGTTPKDAVKQVTAISGWSKRDVFDLMQSIKAKTEL